MKRTIILILAAFAIGFAALPAEAGQDKIVICHANGNGQYVTLALPYNAVFGKNSQSAHFNEQGTPNAGHERDYLGPCIPSDTTTSEVTSSTSTTSTTTTPSTTTTSSGVSTSTTSTTSATTTTVRQSTSTSTPKQNTSTTRVTSASCDDSDTCPATTTSEPGSTTSTEPPVTLAYGGSDTTTNLTLLATMFVLLGAAGILAARRPA